MKDDDQIMLVAAEHIRRRGPQAVRWLLEQAELAEAVADHEGAKTWREIPAAAEAILRSHAGRDEAEDSERGGE